MEILAKEHGISAAELVGSLVMSDFEELVDFAKTITRLCVKQRSRFLLLT